MWGVRVESGGRGGVRLGSGAGVCDTSLFIWMLKIFKVGHKKLRIFVFRI